MIGWVEEEHGVEQRGAVDGLLVEGRVDVVEQLVACFDCHFRGFGDACPDVVLLVEDPGGVVVAVEGVERPQHGPAGAELLGRVASVAAYVRSDHRDLVDTCECNHLGNGDSVVRPVGIVVTKPVTNVAAGACKGAAGYDQRSKTGAAIKHGAAARFAHHRAVQIVGVVFGKAVGVDKICVDGEITKSIRAVVDGICWIKKVTVGQPQFGACSPDLSLFDLPPPYAAVGRRLEVCWKPGNRVTCVRADRRNWRGITVRSGERCWITARIGAEVGGLVHVDPKPINVNAIGWTEKAGEFAIPVALGVFIKPIRESGDTRPDDT